MGFVNGLGGVNQPEDDDWAESGGVFGLNQRQQAAEETKWAGVERGGSAEGTCNHSIAFFEHGRIDRMRQEYDIVPHTRVKNRAVPQTDSSSFAELIVVWIFFLF